MRARFEEFSLALHPEKTRLIECGRYAASNRKQRGLGKPESFTFLGLPLSAVTRRGHFNLSADMPKKLKEIKEELCRRMHQPTPEQGRWLRQVVTGFFNAVPTNARAWPRVAEPLARLLYIQHRPVRKCKN
jgi:hypothetical protein